MSTIGWHKLGVSSGNYQNGNKMHQVESLRIYDCIVVCLYVYLLSMQYLLDEFGCDTSSKTILTK